MHNLAEVPGRLVEWLRPEERKTEEWKTGCDALRCENMPLSLVNRGG